MRADGGAQVRQNYRTHTHARPRAHTQQLQLQKEETRKTDNPIETDKPMTQQANPKYANKNAQGGKG